MMAAPPADQHHENAGDSENGSFRHFFIHLVCMLERLIIYDLRDNDFVTGTYRACTRGGSQEDLLVRKRLISAKCELEPLSHDSDTDADPARSQAQCPPGADSSERCTSARFSSIPSINSGKLIGLARNGCPLIRKP